MPAGLKLAAIADCITGSSSESKLSSTGNSFTENSVASNRGIIDASTAISVTSSKLNEE